MLMQVVGGGDTPKIKKDLLQVIFPPNELVVKPLRKHNCCQFYPEPFALNMMSSKQGNSYLFLTGFGL